jgi:hypothetical protein
MKQGGESLHKCAQHSTGVLWHQELADKVEEARRRSAEMMNRGENVHWECLSRQQVGQKKAGARTSMNIFKL